MRPAIQVGLSTASVYPLKTEAAFEVAAELGYDGVEVMVWAEPVSQDVGALSQLSRRYGMPVLSLHAPCLLISQRVWGPESVLKLDRSVQAAERLGAQTVVVHPPFRWQRRYADGFSDQVAWLEERSDVMVAVENMFPFRADRFFGSGQPSIERMRRRGGRPGPESPRSPLLRPAGRKPCPLHPLDLSHTATAGTDAMDMARRIGRGWCTSPVRRQWRVHRRTPRSGRGTQPTHEVCQMLAGSDFAGHVVLEVTTSGARTKAERDGLLANR